MMNWSLDLASWDFNNSRLSVSIEAWKPKYWSNCVEIALISISLPAWNIYICKLEIQFESLRCIFTLSILRERRERNSLVCFCCVSWQNKYPQFVSVLVLVVKQGNESQLLRGFESTQIPLESLSRMDDRWRYESWMNESWLRSILADFSHLECQSSYVSRVSLLLYYPQLTVFWPAFLSQSLDGST